MKPCIAVCVALLMCSSGYALEGNPPAEAEQGSAMVAESQPEAAPAMPLPSGNPADVLRILASSYDSRATDEASRANVEEQRMALLDTIATDGAFTMGAETRDVRAIQSTFERMLALPDELPLGVNIVNDLSSLYYLNFVIVTADGSDAGGFMSAATERDYSVLLDKSDPAIVATVLFLARKGQVKLTAARVLQRWEKNPLQWNDVCTEQALLFIAKQGEAVLRGLKPTKPEVQKALRKLVPVPWGTCQAQMFFFAREGKPRNKLQITIPQAGSILISSAAQKNWLDAKSSSAGVVEIRSGRWLLKSTDGVASGESKPVEHKQGIFYRLLIPFVKSSL